MWKKKYKFKFVDFSHGTAKKNPDMVIREYRRLINHLDSEIQPLKEEDYRLNVFMPDYRVREALSGYRSLVAINVSALDIIKFYEEIQREKASQLRKLAFKKEIEAELSIFKEKYKS